jgi:hypothetical protein
MGITGLIWVAVVARGWLLVMLSSCGLWWAMGCRWWLAVASRGKFG